MGLTRCYKTAVFYIIFIRLDISLVKGVNVSDILIFQKRCTNNVLLSKVTSHSVWRTSSRWKTRKSDSLYLMSCGPEISQFIIMEYSSRDREKQVAADRDHQRQAISIQRFSHAIRKAYVN